ncbi:MFS transporter [Candidatus Neptunochlamydia vexilliferae]|uniref:Lysosomal dipeptide transporter MFSD1 n=1 Tax=Candidatus Neptunichlamydia vexilliferae TaxID=1651774 RepID=A0ABS0B2Z2_9BACT|nr:MFS transporter [Candidatus Neptunochlamydia vexilliferae]MBF5059935.1 hypothetical protein [Candidatus Neptunochlamydia vexilliferae]
MKHQKTFTAIGFFIWTLASLFYLYEFFLRVFISTISDQVIHDLHLTAQKFAIMGAGYYLAYSLMQIPVGILVDRFGSRLLLSIAVALASIGGGWFAFAQSFGEGFISRCFMGFGSSFAYICLLVLAINWFPKKHFALMVGIANFLGALGPFLAGGPLSLLLNLFNNNWRLVLTFTAGSGFILALATALFVRNNPSRKKGEIVFLDPYKEPLKVRIWLLIRSSQVWAVVLYAGITYVCLPLLGAYWGTSFLQARGLSRDVAASISSMLWIGFAIGAPLTGKISDSMKRRNPVMILCALLGVFVSVCIVYWPTTPVVPYGILFFGIGFASSGISVSYASIAEHVESKLHATALGLNNSMVTFSAAIIPPFISWLIQRAAGPEVHHLTVSNFKSGLFLMPFIYFTGFLIALFWIRETYCRSQHEVIKVSRLS